MAIRYLFCPICGQRVQVEVESGKLPEVHTLPDHEPLGNANPNCGPANLCRAYDVGVTLRLGKCSQCGHDTVKNKTGLCIDCFVKMEE